MLNLNKIIMDFKNFKKEIPAEKINAFCKKEFGTLPTSGKMPSEIYHSSTAPLEERFMQISKEVYGQACSKDDAGYILVRFERFL